MGKASGKTTACKKVSRAGGGFERARHFFVMKSPGRVQGNATAG